MIKYLKDFFSYKGKIDRRTYLISLPITFIMAFLIFLVFLGGMYLFGFFSNSMYSKAFFEAIMFTSLVVTYFFPAIKRLHDINFSTWFYTPFILIGIIYWMMLEDVNSKLGVKFRFEILSGFEMTFAILTTGLIGISLIISLILLFKKGIKGPNPHGPEPLEVSNN